VVPLDEKAVTEVWLLFLLGVFGVVLAGFKAVV